MSGVDRASRRHGRRLIYCAAFLVSCVLPAGLHAEELRTLEAVYLRLITDLPPDPAVDGLPEIFDAAVPLWTHALELPSKSLGGWRMEGRLIRDFERFQKAKLVDDVPRLRTGYQLGRKLWLLEQQSVYYTRHLLLHEGVHGLIDHVFGGLGPPWYQEGMAELLATHRLEDGRPIPAVIPVHRDAVPMWGRIKLIRDDVVAGKKRSVNAVLSLQPDEYDDPDAYAWSWAFCVFLWHDPDYRPVLVGMTSELRRGRHSREAFNRLFLERLGHEKRRQLAIAWLDFIDRIDYGYDMERNRIVDWSPGSTPPAAGMTMNVRSDHAWQNSGIRLEEGKTYRIDAKGRFELARFERREAIGKQPPPDIVWVAEPNGVSIRYCRGLPLGMLLLAVLPENVSTDEDTDQVSLEPYPIGSGGTYRASRSGTLFFRINDFPDNLANNKGDITVAVKPCLPPEP